jgi:AcrR family transcriptional regulator
VTEITKRVPREVRERDMLRAATRVFSQRGYHAASMDEIAERAGISKPMVYAYFGSKEGLYLACIRAAGEAMANSIAGAVARELSPEQRVWQGSLALFRFVARQRDAWAVLNREASAQGGPSAAEVAGMRRDVIRLVARLLTERAAEADGGDPRAVDGMEPLAHAIVGAGESLANWWLEHPEEPPERLAAHLMDLAWIGLEGVTAGRRWPRRDAAAER